MDFNYDKLRGKIKEKCGTQDRFAERMNLGRVSISQRLNNKLDFTSKEIEKACKILDIPYSEIPEYFFRLTSSETRTTKTA